MKTEQEKFRASLVIAGMLEGISVLDAENVLDGAKCLVKQMSDVKLQGHAGQAWQAQWASCSQPFEQPEQYSLLLTSAHQAAFQLLWPAQE